MLQSPQLEPQTRVVAPAATLTEAKEQPDMAQTSESKKTELPARWKELQSAIWLIGLAIIALQGWWWPGILVLVAISGVTQAFIADHVEKKQAQADAVVKQKDLETTRATALPENCSGCGAPLDAKSVIWRSDTNASCPYCNKTIRASRPVQPFKRTD